MLLVNNIFGITGGANGLSGIDQPSIFGFTFKTTWARYYLVLFFVIIAIVAMRRLENSPLDRHGPTCVRTSWRLKPSA